MSARVEDLLARMTLEEKAGQLVQVANPDPELDAPALAAGAFGSAIVASGEHAGNVRDAGTQAAHVDALQRAATSGRLGIPLLVARDVIHGHRTVFPVPLGQAASFDADLVRAAARVAAREASADGIRWTFAPMLDVARDPRWGRVAEGYGESAWLTAHLGAAAVQGFQGDDLADAESLAACAKHYVGYGLATGGRDYAEVDVGPRTLHHVHVRPFREAVAAGVATVMSAFHTLDGVPMTAHTGLLRTHLRGGSGGGLGFDGVVVSDWDAVGELLLHGVAGDLPDAACLALTAGVDVDMVTAAYRHLPDLVRAGRLDAALLDDAARRVLLLKERLGLFDRPFTGAGRAASVHLAPTHRELARTAAQQACVLLRDDGPLLPLREPGRVLLTGPFATARAELFGTWTLDGRGEDAVSVADAARERWGDAVTVDDGRWPELALQAARAADVVVACVGEHPMRSGEANSVTTLDLPAGQVELLEALARVSRRLVVVAVTGRPLAMDRLASLGDALVLVLHPGVEGGHGIVDVLAGDAPASGRLPMSLPWSVGHVPVFHDHRPTGRPLDPEGDVGRYRDHADGPAFPFGFGLGHSPVTYGPVRLSAPTLAPGETVTVTARVGNAGKHPVLETAQLYVRARPALRPQDPVSRPVAELVGVRRVALAPGEAQDVALELDAGLLATRDACGAPVPATGPFLVTVAPHAGAATGTTPPTGARLDVVTGPTTEGQP